MDADLKADPVLSALFKARPETDLDVTSSSTAAAVSLRESIIAEGRHASTRRRPSGYVTAAVAAAITVAVAAAAFAVDTRGRATGVTARGTDPAPVNLPPGAIQKIADESAAALSGTGRAEVTFSLDPGRMTEQSGSGTVTFAGDDLEMLMRFEGRDGRPGFEAANRTVDGSFYLLDGPPGAKRWYRDDNAAGGRGSDLFSIDPRTMVVAIHPDVEFVVVGTEESDGTRLRHLRATRPSSIPPVNLSLGPIDPKTVETLEVWVDDNDILRRLDLTTRYSDTQPESATKVVGADGRVQIVASEGTKTVEHVSAYSVRFHSIGEPIEIRAPDKAIPFSGLG